MFGLLLLFLDDQVSLFLKKPLSFLSGIFHFLSKSIGQLLGFLDISLGASNSLSSKGSQLLLLKLPLSLQGGFFGSLDSLLFLLSGLFNGSFPSFLSLSEFSKSV